LSNNDEIKPDKSIDTIGLFCPAPLFETRENIDTLDIGQVLEVIADDPAAEEDLKRFAKRTGHEVLKFEKIEDYMKFYIKKMK